MGAWHWHVLQAFAEGGAPDADPAPLDASLRTRLIASYHDVAQRTATMAHRMQGDAEAMNEMRSTLAQLDLGAAHIQVGAGVPGAITHQRGLRASAVVRFLPGCSSHGPCPHVNKRLAQIAGSCAKALGAAPVALRELLLPSRWRLQCHIRHIISIT